MKLELKHLAPYLPYGLEIQVSGENVDDDSEGLPRIFTMVGIVDGEVIRNKKGYISNVEEEVEDVFPILRPLSDLTTSHNIFEDKAICFIDESDNGGSFTIDDIYFKYKESSFSDWRNAYLLLLENHFDVLGLIEKGLAIDINTI